MEIRRLTASRADKLRRDSMYVIQHRKYHWKNEWDTFPGRYQSLVEAKEAFEKLHPLTKPSARIAEEYTVTRYKAVR